VDNGELPPFAHHSWLTFSLSLVPADPARVFHARSAAHLLSAVERGSRRMQWFGRDDEREWSEEKGVVQIVPCDGDSHTFVMRSDEGCTVHAVLIPSPHLDGCFPSKTADGTADGIADGRRAARDGQRGRRAEDGGSARDASAPVLFRDDMVWRCVLRLARRDGPAGDAFDCPRDEAARALIGRLRKLNGHDTPRWHDGASIFQPQTVDRLVGRIDGSLRRVPTINEMSNQVGLSTSHFTKKFRLSTGYAPQRLINRRRIQASLQSLQDQSLSPADVATLSGFSSQSHFTRLFSGMTGLTPARYQAQFRPNDN
jgi:AraC-like DNA-binding protein